jgi:hypothetical protein
MSTFSEQLIAYLDAHKDDTPEREREEIEAQARAFDPQCRIAVTSSERLYIRFSDTSMFEAWSSEEPSEADAADVLDAMDQLGLAFVDGELRDKRQ